MNLDPIRTIITCLAILGSSLLGCEAPLPVIPDNTQEDGLILDTSETSDVGTADLNPPQDTSEPVDLTPVEDITPAEDTSDLEDTLETPDAGEPDVPVEPDVEEEDLSGVKLTWKKDIEPISIDKCDNCHGKDGSHGLKLYTKQKWIDYFPMIIPALEKGSMPQGTSLAPGQFEDIILWGKVGYP